MRYRANTSEVRWRTVDGEAVLIHIVTTYYYSLNGSGTRMWELLVADALSEVDLATALAQTFPQTPPADLAADVHAWLADMLEEGLVIPVETGPT